PRPLRLPPAVAEQPASSRTQMPADQRETSLALGGDHHHLSRSRHHAGQRRDGGAVRDEHHITPRPPLPGQHSELADLIDPCLFATEEIAEWLPRLDGAEGEPRRLEAAAPRTRQHTGDHDPPRAKPLADAPRAPAALRA